MKKYFISLLINALFAVIAFSQPIGVNTNLNDNDLVQTLGGPGVIISNVSVTAAAGSYGQFTNGNVGQGNIGIASGLILTTGTITGAVGPNPSGSQNNTTINGVPGNALLDALNQGTTEDATVVEFDVNTTGTILTFNYVFGSEEYHEYVESNYNDVFAFFISGPGINGNQNLAIIPGTNLPVSIHNINNGDTFMCQSSGPGNNANFFVDNCNGLSVSYDGFTTVFQARAVNLNPCETYHITLAIADVGDSQWDSGVFIREGTFNSPGGTGFTTAINCNNGNWSVTATATDPQVINHRWELWCSNTPGGPATLVNTINGGLTATFSWLDLSKFYFIRHVSVVCGHEFVTEHPVPTFQGNATASFTIENANGTPTDTFCFGEPIFLDGTASTNYDRFYLNSVRRPAGSPPNTPFQHHADYGWTIDNSIGVLNLSEEFLNHGLNPGEIFEPGFEYEIQLAIANIPQCIPWTETTRRFTVICCGTGDPSFTLTPYCNGGNWSVTATPSVNTPASHIWQLFESNGTQVGADQTGTTANFQWLDQSKQYFVKHIVFVNGCYHEELSQVVPGFAGLATLNYKLVNAAGVQKEVFCYGEDVYLDPTGTTNYDRYFMSLWRRPISGGPFTYYANYGWTFTNNIGLINLSQLFFNSGENPGDVFEPGYVYELQFAIANPPNCIPWIELKRQFIVECCEGFFSPSFKLNLLDTEGGLSLEVFDFETYGNINAIHQWTVLSSPNPDGGPYTVLLETTTTGPGPFILYDQGESGVYYFVVHKVTTLCGEYCYGKRREGHNGESQPDSGGEDDCELCGVIDCDILGQLCMAPDYEYAYCNPFGPKGVTFVWNPAPSATLYYVQINYNDPACCHSGLPSTSTYTTANTNMFLGGLERYCFSWRIGALCNGQVIWTEYHCFTGCDGSSPTGGGGIGLAQQNNTDHQATSAIAQPQAASVYPNPAGDELNILLPVDVVASELNIVDMYGHIVFKQSKPSQKTVVDSSVFATGVYAVRIVYPNGDHIVNYVVINH